MGCILASSVVVYMPLSYDFYTLLPYILFPFLFSSKSVSQGPVSPLLPPIPTLQTPANYLFLLLRHVCLARLVSQTGVLLDFLLSLHLSYFPGLNLFRTFQNLHIHFSAPESHSLQKPLLRICLNASQLAKWTQSHAIKGREWRRKIIPTGKYCRPQSLS